MAAIRKSNLTGKKRWVGRDSTRQENSFRSYRTSEHTSLPPLPKSQQALSRRRGTTSSFLRKNNSSVVSNTSLEGVKPQRLNNKNSRTRDRASIPVMPDGSKVPLWLMRWNSLHRHSAAIAFLLVCATLVVYGWTVYSQHLWSRSYKKLQYLQRDERQLTKHDEALKNKMAQEAEKPHSGLVSPTPANTIFLQETPPSSSQQVGKESLGSESQPSNAVGY
ncbi:hypothetical protein [Calothrix sp. CCY 0018]|uniref:hypothetical protein n=1 Tax=Calothrix sp. CCY 0018 TaxID=3103864 RepID=UPI0039C61DFC